MTYYVPDSQAPGLAAAVAARKGHSFLGYFIFSLFLWPFALITAYVVKDRTMVRDQPAV